MLLKFRYSILFKPEAGTYSWIVRDANGCTMNGSETITQSNANPVVLNCPNNKTEASSKTQDVLNVDFAAWLQSFSYTGGTNPVLTLAPCNPVAPVTYGGSIQVT